MKNFPFGQAAILALVVLATAPVLLGMALVRHESPAAGRHGENCLLFDAACLLSDVARFTRAAPTGAAPSTTKKGVR